MRKINAFISNIYKVVILKSNGKKLTVNYSETGNHDENDMVSEAFLRKIIIEDQCCLETGDELQKTLVQRVTKKGPASSMARNSIFDVFLPLFSLKQIELKMAVVSLALVITLGLGPTYNHSVNRSLNPYFLADTLSDSSDLSQPLVHDSAVEGASR